MSKLSRSEVLEKLANGFTIRYFFLEGGVLLEDQAGNRLEDAELDISIFLKLRQDGLIEVKRRNVSGWPQYANNARADIYAMAEDACPN